MKDHSKTKFGGGKMKKNSTSKKLKALVAVILVMASLFAMTVFVSAEFIEEVFNEICATMAASTSSADHSHVPVGTTTYSWQCPHGGYECSTVVTCSICGCNLTVTGKKYPCPQGLCSNSR